MKTGNLRPNEQRAKNAIMLIWIVLGLEVVLFISSNFQLELLNRMAIGSNYTMEEATANDTREGILGMVYLITFIVSAVMFIKWFRRAY